MDRDKVQLSREEMRSLGYRVVDILVAHFAKQGGSSLGASPSREELEARLREDPPEEGTDPHAVLDRVEADVLPNTARVDPPRFLGFVPAPNNFVGVLAEKLLRDRPAWTVVTPAQMGVVTFRCVPAGWDEEAADGLDRRLVPALNEEGVAFLTKTTLDGRPVLRLCPIHPQTAADDVRQTIQALDDLTRRHGGAPPTTPS